MSNAAFVDTFFNQVFDRVQNTLEFKPEWANGTGYLDHCAEGPHAPVLAAGEMAKSIDSFGRPMIIVGLPVGNLVVFRRYTKEDGVYTYNASRHFDEAFLGTFCQGKQTLGDLKKFFGEWSNSENIGQAMKVLSTKHVDGFESTEELLEQREREELQGIDILPSTLFRKHIFTQPRMAKVVSMTVATGEETMQQKVDEWNRSRNNLEAWIALNVSPEKQDELRSLIAAYSTSSELIRRS